MAAISDETRFVSAATYSLTTFAEIFTRSFEGYFYPMAVNEQLFAWRVRVENIDLAASAVMLVGDEAAGIAVLAQRNQHAWCGGFGITAAFRGRGLARDLANALVEHARAMGASRLSLEVLARNEKALKTYLGAGFQIQRDLHIFEWTSEHRATAITENTTVRKAEPRMLLAHFDQLHPARAAWQRDLPALLVKSGMQGLALMRDELPAAYVLFSQRDEQSIRVDDLGAIDTADAVALLRALQCRATHVTSVNEPSDSAVLGAYTQTGFKETDRQHELELAL